jgi:hypothetical protein
LIGVARSAVRFEFRDARLEALDFLARLAQDLDLIVVVAAGDEIETPSRSSRCPSRAWPRSRARCARRVHRASSNSASLVSSVRRRGRPRTVHRPAAAPAHGAQGWPRNAQTAAQIIQLIDSQGIVAVGTRNATALPPRHRFDSNVIGHEFATHILPPASHT